MSDVKELRGQLSERRATLAKIFEEAGEGRDSEGRQVFDLGKAEGLEGDSAARVAQVQKLNAELEDLHDRVKAQDDLAAAAARLGEMGDVDRGAIHPAAGRTAADSNEPPKSLGQLLVESAAFRDYQRGSQGLGPVSHFDVGFGATLFETGAGWAPESVRTGRVEFKPLRPAPHVIDAIPEFTAPQADAVPAAALSQAPVVPVSPSSRGPPTLR